MSQSGPFSRAGGGATVVLTLTGTQGGPVAPDGAGNIDILGGSGVLVVGNPGANSLTIQTLGAEETLTTTDAVPTTIETVPINPDEAALLTVNVIAAQDTYASSMGGVLYAVVRNVGGGAVVCGAPQGFFMDDTAGAPNVTFLAVGGNIEVQVTGVAGTTINWRCFTNILYDN